ncbi:MAG: acetylornithine deacetylase [Kangiellaceae bacterium]|nr:acetylornithine deacetylase [Kangiellaceae bacterium]MCW9017740.1 acetylornithine deacetylase [Kangiellaceae bacterium]
MGTSTSLQSTLRHLEDLVSADTQNPPRTITKDSPIFEYIKLNLPNFSFEFFDAGDGCISLLAQRGSPALLFNFHIDTVPIAQGWETDPHKLEIVNGKAYGLGACDIKGAAACMLTAANNTSGDLALLFSSDEEYGSSAAIKYFLSLNKDFKKVIVAEPTEAKAVTAHRGIQSAVAKFSGISGHASEARAFSDNAIHKATKWSSKTLDWISQQVFEFQNLNGLPFNIGKIEGGIKANMIAADCTLSFGFRTLPGQCASTLLSSFSELHLAQDDLEIVAGFTGPSLPAPNQEFELSIQHAETLASQFNLPIGDAVNFWTEASLFSQSGAIAIVFGPGNIAQAHTANEWVEFSQLEKVYGHYLNIIDGGTSDA